MDKLLFKRILIALLSILIISYTVYLIAGLNMAKTVETEEAVNTAVTDIIYTDGFIIRDEDYIINDTDGVLSYNVTNGEDISVGQTIADVYKHENDAVYRQQIKAVNTQIKNLRQLSESYYKDIISLNTVDSQIETNLYSFLNNVNTGNYSNAKNNSSDLLLSICERQMITGEAKDFTAKIIELKNRKKELQSNCSSKIGAVSSDKAGYFVSSSDGYEKSFNYKQVNKLMLDDFNKIKKSKVPSNAIGKVITKPEWYIACEISSDDAVSLSKLLNLDIGIYVNMPSLTTEKIPAKIYSVNQKTKNDNAVLILLCDYMNEYISTARSEKLEITTISYEGLKIPKRSIHEDVVNRTVKKNGKEVTEEKRVQGVYVLHGSELQFKEISIVYSSTDYVLCNQYPDEDTLFSDRTVELYDQVVIKGDNLYDGKVIR